jgi:hypothetical protein
MKRKTLRERAEKWLHENFVAYSPSDIVSWMAGYRAGRRSKP